MTRYLAVGLVLLGWAGWAVSTTVEQLRFQPLSMTPHSSEVIRADFVGNEVARAICVGDGRSYLGVYVFDQHGNCVARDDLNPPQTGDDLAAEWFPTTDGAYLVEVVNFGNMLNTCSLALK